MIVRPPCIITPRLLPGIRVADATISVEWIGTSKHFRRQWRWFIDGPDFTDEGDELETPRDHRIALAALVGFLQSWADPDSGIHDPDNPIDPPFSPATLRWAADHDIDLFEIREELEQ